MKKIIPTSSQLGRKIFFQKKSYATGSLCPLNFADIPGPKSYPVIGTVYEYLPGIGNYSVDRMHHGSTKKLAKYGTIVKEEVTPGQPLVFLYDPSDIELLFRTEDRWPSRYSHSVLEYYRMVHHRQHHQTAGLLPTNGAIWGQLRTSYQKAFHRDVIRSFVSNMDSIIMDLVDSVNSPKLQKVGQKDFLTIIMALNCELIGSNFFDVKWGALDNVDNPNALTEQLSYGSTFINANIDKTDHGLQLWKYFQTPLYRKVAKYVSLLEKTAEECISRLEKEDRRDKPPCVADLWMRDEKNNRQDIITMSADMILAGIDTTSYTLGFLMYQLGTNERVQAKLYKELCSLDPEKKAPMTVDLLSQAAYSRKIIKETLRLNPVAIGNGRILTENKCFGGYPVPEQTMIVTMNQIISRLPEYYELPDEFIPERYDSAGYFKKTRPFVTLPFGHGPRGCIGRRLAEQIMQIFIFRMYRHYQIIWKGPPNIDCLTHNINKPDTPLKFEFIPRAS